MKSTYKDQLTLYDQLVGQCSRFERKGKTMPYTSSNGYMFSLLNKAGELGIRFSEERKKEIIAEFKSDIFKSYGATMRGYVLMTNEMLNDQKVIQTFLNESFDYVNTLEPK